MVRRRADKQLEAKIEQRPLDPYLIEVVMDPIYPPATAMPELLPFNQRSAQDFERICVVVAEQVDGLRDVRLYGVSGQRQDGIDLVGWDTDGQAVVYQARRWATFSDRALRKSVNDYAAAGRAFGAKRFVVCVATSARRTEIIDELDRQRKIREFGVDLYDQERLSEMLRPRHDLVRRLFSPEWEGLFCGAERATPPTRSSSDILADALLRSPLDALGLAETAAQAERLLDKEPGKAAEWFQSIAENLKSSAFAGFSDIYRMRQAECKRRAGELSEVVHLLTEVAWRNIEKGVSSRANQAFRKLEELSREAEAPVATAVISKVLAAVDQWYANPYYDLNKIASAVIQLVERDAPGAHDAALWLAESAVVTESYNLIQRIADTLEAVAATREANNSSDATATRLRVCIADSTGHWDRLRDKALQGRLGSKQATLVHARIGRFQSWIAEPESANTSYRLAIGQACQANINAEASEALHSIWMLGARYGLPDEDWGGALDLAKDIQVAGTDYLQSAYDHREAGLSELSNGKLPSAHDSLRANLRVATISGRFAAELDAHSLLGRLYLRADEYDLAARHYIRAGDTKVLEEWFSKLDKYVDCTKELDRPAPWEQAATLSALAAEGDLIPDEQVEHLINVALDRSSGRRQSPFGPQVWLSAYKLLAALASRIPSSQVDAILDLLDPFIEREKNQYRFSDDEHVRIIVGLFIAHPERCDRIGPHLLSLMVASPDLGSKVLEIGLSAIRSGRDALIEGLFRLANNGSKAALEALLYLEIEHPLLVDEARKLLEIAVNTPKREPGHYGIGSILPHAARFIRLLEEKERVLFAETAMSTAEDETEMEANRMQAVEAVGVVARLLPDEMRSSLFNRVMSLAYAPTYSEMDKHLRASLHPLSRFHIDLGAGLLVCHTVRVAALLAQAKGQYGKVIESALLLFKTGDEMAANLAAHSLAMLPIDEVLVDVQMLAASPLSAARQLAVILWVHQPEDVPLLGETLATDSNRDVRNTLASSLMVLRERNTDLADQLTNSLSKDPSASVRANVSNSAPIR